MATRICHVVCGSMLYVVQYTCVPHVHMPCCCLLQFQIQHQPTNHPHVFKEMHKLVVKLRRKDRNGTIGKRGKLDLFRHCSRSIFKEMTHVPLQLSKFDQTQNEMNLFRKPATLHNMFKLFESWALCLNSLLKLS